MRSTRVVARHALVFALYAAPFALPQLLTAQIVTPGNRPEMSDVTAPSVSSLFTFETGTTRTFGCEVAWGVRAAAEELAAQLSGGRLQSRSATLIRRTPSAEAQRRVSLQMNGQSDRHDADAITAALAGTDSRRRKAAASLTRSINKLLVHARTMDPRRPGHATASELSHAVYRFNQFADMTDSAFRADPPDEFLVIESVLSQMVVASLENDGRTADAASLRGDYGLACAPAPVFVAPPPPVVVLSPAPPPMERAIEVCVLESDRIHYVPAILLPETGDTIALRNGIRAPFREINPDTGYAGASEWVKSGEAITVGTARFIPYGAPETVKPEDVLLLTGSFRGVPVFTTKDGGTPPKRVLVPIDRPCIVQPYIPVQDIRKVR